MLGWRQIQTVNSVVVLLEVEAEQHSGSMVVESVMAAGIARMDFLEVVPPNSGG